MMSSELKLHLNIEYGELRASFEGGVEEVFEALVKFLMDTIPTFSVAQKILYTANLTELIRRMEGIALITPEGRVILEDTKIPVSNAICIGLAGAYIARKIGKAGDDSFSPIELSRIIGKATKSVRNELPNLINNGLIERVDKGKYKITSAGLWKVENEIIPALKRS
ncbi:MAG: hypothetical protein QXL67_03685 [Candidatus Bathyarchaeia archaeon]